MSFKTTFFIIELKILLLSIQLTCFSYQRTYVKFHLRNYYDHSFHKHTSLGSPKRTHYFNLKRNHGVSIENTYCYWLSSIVTQSVGNIWSTYDLMRRSKPLLTSVQVQYSLKVKRQYNKATWWGHDYLIALSHDSP